VAHTQEKEKTKWMNQSIKSKVDIL